MVPVNPDLLCFTKYIQQDNRAVFTIVCPEDGLQSLKGAVHNGNGAASFEQVLFGLE
jgi:hypothetical protein